MSFSKDENVYTTATNRIPARVTNIVEKHRVAEKT
jgi:hypothetical protein